jgi:hypothetical protein
MSNELPTWHCQACNKKFTVGEWICVDGQSNHVVAEKTYRSVDAPSDPGHPAQGGQDSLRDGRTRVCNIPPDKTVQRNGELHLVPGGYIEFVRGRFSTSDPEVQYHLDKRPAYNATEAQWESAWLSKSQQFELDKMRLNAERQRLENMNNELLAQVKQKVGARA